MELIHTIEELKRELSKARIKGEKIGLVPTMGALHEGHASLVKRCVKENDVTVVSVFLNPTQFNDKVDLEKYPRMLEADCRLMEEVGANIVFAPSVEEMYPEPDTRKFSYPPIDSVMEGAFRPGHFNGVCQIVSKLFMAVEPDRAYFGEKDFQQIAVIRAMVKDLKFKVQIIACPIVREESCLAMSSRNMLLYPEERKIAANIFKVLSKSKNFATSHTLKETQCYVIDTLNAIVGLEVQYFSIVDGNTLQELERWTDSDYIVGCITVYCGSHSIRLIDHIQYKGKE
ncbi:MAG: pantoate--beta-alanine ligase [Paraprevotella sp.]|nr:pantoate--beta-alanine ligase [Paraprevotella sp.]